VIGWWREGRLRRFLLSLKWWHFCGPEGTGHKQGLGKREAELGSVPEGAGSDDIGIMYSMQRLVDPCRVHHRNSYRVGAVCRLLFLFVKYLTTTLAKKSNLKCESSIEKIKAWPACTQQSSGNETGEPKRVWSHEAKTNDSGVDQNEQGSGAALCSRREKRHALGGEVRWQNRRRAKHALLVTSEAKKAGAPIGDEQETRRTTSRDSKQRLIQRRESNLILRRQQLAAKLTSRQGK
jgi:hypothetical protein